VEDRRYKDRDDAPKAAQHADRKGTLTRTTLYSGDFEIVTSVDDRTVAIALPQPVGFQ
jgi:hypothetical protein